MLPLALSIWLAAKLAKSSAPNPPPPPATLNILESQPRPFPTSPPTPPPSFPRSPNSRFIRSADTALAIIRLTVSPNDCSMLCVPFSNGSKRKSAKAVCIFFAADLANADRPLLVVSASDSIAWNCSPALLAARPKVSMLIAPSPSSVTRCAISASSASTGVRTDSITRAPSAKTSSRLRCTSNSASASVRDALMLSSVCA